MAAEDGTRGVADVALTEPLNGITEIAGPERVGMESLVGRYLTATDDTKQVFGNPEAGMKIDDQFPTPGYLPGGFVRCHLSKEGYEKIVAITRTPGTR
jgi:hypothetical protein